MFKVKGLEETDDRIKTVYAVKTNEEGETVFLFHYFEGWIWESANEYEPYEEY